MALDKAPRYFVLKVEEIEVELNASQGHDMVEIEFAGKVSPGQRERLAKAMEEGNLAMTERKLL
jgi:hypothetical protein